MSTVTQILKTSESEQNALDRRNAELARIFVHGDGRRVRVDRRQNSIPVAVERRKNVDRRDGADRREKRIRFEATQSQTGIS